MSNLNTVKVMFMFCVDCDNNTCPTAFGENLDAFCEMGFCASVCAVNMDCIFATGLLLWKGIKNSLIVASGCVSVGLLLNLSFEQSNDVNQVCYHRHSYTVTAFRRWPHRANGGGASLIGVCSVLDSKKKSSLSAIKYVSQSFLLAYSYWIGLQIR